LAIGLAIIVLGTLGVAIGVSLSAQAPDTQAEPIVDASNAPLPREKQLTFHRLSVARFTN
jgi:hypothetical protein